MATEIEHKYIVVDDSYKAKAVSATHIRQGYLSVEKERTVRVRILGEKGFITVKGATVGDSRLEFEYEIPVDDAEAMLNELCYREQIDKHRYVVEHDGMKWEVDQFHGALQGLVIAEIELPSQDYAYSLPSFVGKNVTGDPRFYNSNLMNLQLQDLKI